ncbi:MAG: DUF3109 family protein [Paludibacteraceae bacterium]|nr:DUF3109 family protein [Paludibacteraceae bacterium]
MFIIGDTLVSLDVLEKEFCCDLDKCRGCCCIEGDAGCPVTDDELKLIEAMLPQLLPHMTPEAREVVKQQGLSYLDPSGEQVLSIVNGKDCIFARTDHNGWCYCLIEKMNKNSQFSILHSQFTKPLSCHLYPVRLTQVGGRVGVEYHRWDICHCARVLGKKQHIPLYKFLREPLIRRFGKEWYNELCLVAEEWKKQMKNDQMTK